MSREKLIEALKEETLLKAKSIKDTALGESDRILGEAKAQCESIKERKLGVLKDELVVKSLAEAESRKLHYDSQWAACREVLFQELVIKALSEVMADKDGSYKSVLKKIYGETIDAFKVLHGSENFAVYLCSEDDKKLVGNSNDLIDDTLEKGTVSVRAIDSPIEFRSSIEDKVKEASEINRAKVMKAVFGE